MTAEGVVGLVAGLAAGSIALVGWALGSGIEGLASVIVVWRFTGSRTLSPTSERRAQQLVAVSFWLLAPYIAVEAIRDLAGHHPASATSAGHRAHGVESGHHACPRHRQAPSRRTAELWRHRR
jgi:hypothetical protein